MKPVNLAGQAEFMAAPASAVKPWADNIARSSHTMTDQFHTDSITMATDNSVEISKRFSGKAEQYQQHAKVQAYSANRLANWLNQTGLIVDLGAGPGTNLALFPKDCPLLAIDIALPMLSRWRHTAQLHREADVANSMVDSQLSFEQTKTNTEPNSAYYAVCGSMDSLPLQANSATQIFSNFSLQWASDLTLTLRQCHQALTNDGQLLIGVLCEGSLHEIALSWQAVDNHRHVNQFKSTDHWQRELLAAGFTVTDAVTEQYQDFYPNALQACRSIKAIGANVITEGGRRGLVTPRQWQHVSKAYQQFATEQGFPVSYQLLWLRAAVNR